MGREAEGRAEREALLEPPGCVLGSRPSPRGRSGRKEGVEGQSEFRELGGRTPLEAGGRGLREEKKLTPRQVSCL